MNGYVKYFDDNKYMNVSVHDTELLKNTMQYGITYFNGDKIPQDNEYYCNIVILLDFVVKIDNEYHPQIFLEECKYAMKKKKIMKGMNNTINNIINEELNLDESDDESNNYKSKESDES